MTHCTWKKNIPQDSEALDFFTFKPCEILEDNIFKLKFLLVEPDEIVFISSFIGLFFFCWMKIVAQNHSTCDEVSQKMGMQKSQQKLDNLDSSVPVKKCVLQ